MENDVDSYMLTLRVASNGGISRTQLTTLEGLLRLITKKLGEGLSPANQDAAT